MDKVTPRSGAGLAIVGAVLFVAALGMALWNWSQDQSALGPLGSMTGAAIIIVIGVVWHQKIVARTLRSRSHDTCDESTMPETGQLATNNREREK